MPVRSALSFESMACGAERGVAGTAGLSGVPDSATDFAIDGSAPYAVPMTTDTQQTARPQKARFNVFSLLTLQSDAVVEVNP
jgi:hypothetical protein